MNNITVNGIEYIPATDAPPPSPIRIIIAQRGWVFIGRVTINGEELTITNASTIRRWGTTKGLGQLAATGPTSTTILDETSGAVRMHVLTVVASIDCEESAWPSL